MKNLFLLFVFFLYTFSIKAGIDSLSISLNGQAVAWTTISFQDPVVLQPGGRFVPTLLGKYKISGNKSLDFEASANLNGTLNFSNNELSSTYQLNPYRIWARYFTDKYELRAGLQKINFGSAKIFRPLMWFDEMDVRDPFQLTKGVFGLLGKYFFENNSNLWLWALYGNDKPKGFEYIGTQQKTPELGGRYEFPLGPGEFGVAVHTRKTISYDPLVIDLNGKNEGRIGFNGKWDVGVGLWVEGSFNFTEYSSYVPERTSMLNAGMDYTFPLGNGLGASLEYFRIDASKTMFSPGNSINTFGLMLNYPLNLEEQLGAMFFTIPSQNLYMRYLSYSKSLDNISFYVFGYWNPDAYFSISQLNSNTQLFMGKGLQLMMSYNF